MNPIANLIVKFKKGYGDFRNGLSIIFGKPRPGEGDRKLAKLATIIEGQIDVYGKKAVQRQVIQGIESDLKRTVKKGETAVNSLVQTALDTPEYMHMLNRVGLNESHVRIMAMEALKKNGKK